MDSVEEPDWVDDDSIDLAETLKRFHALEPATLVLGSWSTTSAGSAKIVVIEIESQSRTAPQFA